MFSINKISFKPQNKLIIFFFGFSYATVLNVQQVGYLGIITASSQYRQNCQMNLIRITFNTIQINFYRLTKTHQSTIKLVKTGSEQQ